MPVGSLFGRVLFRDFDNLDQNTGTFDLWMTLIEDKDSQYTDRSIKDLTIDQPIKRL